ncbi:MAG TPA: 50S ribosomal protein L23 [Myxococcota bacterium]|nr:50S ribosomal protein L23 [Myxococcota bacterium]
MNVYEVIRRPLVTEKSNIAREASNVVTLAVNPRASKRAIRDAVESLFSVQVVDVHTMRQPRKSRRVGKFAGRKPEWKKAIVKLAEGQSIEFFEGV